MDPDRASVFYNVKRRLRRGNSEDVFAQFLKLGSYTAAAAALTFALHVVMARLLGPDAYAEFGTYVAILLTFLVASTSIQFVITRFISYHRARYQHEQINYLVTRALKWVFGLGFLIFVLVTLNAQAISDFFNIAEVAPTVLLGFVAWFTVMQPVFEGAFRGLEDLRALGWMRVVEAAARFVFAIVFVSAGFAVAGALFALGLGTFLALALSYRYITRLQRLKALAPSISKVRRYAVPVTITMVSFALLMNLDLILVKHYFAASQAGIFAAASVVGKVPVFVSLVFVGVLFPQVTRLHAHGKPSVRLLRNALVAISAIMAVFTLLFFFFAQPVLTLLFGAAYAIGPVIGFYAFGMSALAVSLVLLTYLLAVQRDRAAFGLPFFVLALFVLLALFHASIAQVMVVVMLVMSALAAYAVYSARDVLEFDYFL